MLLYRARGITARIVTTKDGETVRIQSGGFTLFGKRIMSRRDDLNAAEAATLGASLLGTAISQGGLAKDYAISVIQQLSWDTAE